MAKRTYRLTETVPVTRVYEIEASSRDEALDIMYGGEVDPISEEEGEDMNGIEIEIVHKKKGTKR